MLYVCVYCSTAVAKLGVTVIYTPDGVTAAEWANGCEVFPQPGKVVEIGR